MAIVPVQCPDCSGKVVQLNYPRSLTNGQTIYAVCDECNRHFHGTNNDFLQMNWELPTQTLPDNFRADVTKYREVADTSGPDVQEKL